MLGSHANTGARDMASIRRIHPLKFRTIWISDVHLGFKGCNAEYLLDFLKATQCEYLYLVGDIIDVWALKRSLYWPQTHNNVIRSILGKAKHGTRVIYIPGNHDELFRDYFDMTLGNIEIQRNAIHLTTDGRKLLMLHGDEFDSVIRYSKFLTLLGDAAYSVLLQLNRAVNFIRRKLDFPYWSIAAYLKHKIKNAVNVINDFEQAISREAARHKVDGVVCGHIHHAAIKKVNNILYCNDGDWVESCTAMVENHDGSLRIIHWADEQYTCMTEESLEARKENIA